MKKFGFIGAGKMAGAIIHGILASGKVSAAEVAWLVRQRRHGQKTLGGNVDCARRQPRIALRAVRNDCRRMQTPAAQRRCGGGEVGKEQGACVYSRGNFDCPPARVLPERRENREGNAEHARANFAGNLVLRARIAPCGRRKENGRHGAFCNRRIHGNRGGASRRRNRAFGKRPGYIFEFAAAMIAGAKEIGFSDEEAKKLGRTHARRLGGVARKIAPERGRTANRGVKPGGYDARGSRRFRKERLPQNGRRRAQSRRKTLKRAVQTVIKPTF